METLLFRPAKAGRPGKAHLLTLFSEIAADYNPRLRRLSYKPTDLSGAEFQFPHIS